MPETTPAPAQVGEAGRRLWKSLVTPYDLEEHELALLTRAVRAVDVLVGLDVIVAADELLVETPQGTRPHPALTQARATDLTLAKMLAALRLPQGSEGDRQAGARPQRRGAPRGVYSINPGA
jgi:hypothetical protein